MTVSLNFRAYMCMNISCKQLSNYLKDIGVGKGDAVVIYLPMLMELPIAMLACARIGAVHSVIRIVGSLFPYSS